MDEKLFKKWLNLLNVTTFQSFSKLRQIIEGREYYSSLGLLVYVAWTENILTETEYNGIITGNNPSNFKGYLPPIFLLNLFVSQKHIIPYTSGGNTYGSVLLPYSKLITTEYPNTPDVRGGIGGVRSSSLNYHYHTAKIISQITTPLGTKINPCATLHELNNSIEMPFKSQRKLLETLSNDGN